MSDPRPKYLPKPAGLDRALFRAAIDTGRLHVQTCDDCGHHQHPPRYFCSECHSKSLGFAPVSGTGTVFSWTVSHFTTDRGWASEMPYATVVVELDEGPRIVGTFAGPNDELESGLAVTVRTEEKTPDFAYFWFDQA